MKTAGFFCSLLMLLLTASQPGYGQNYRQLRQVILDQQQDTRSEIEQIDALINQYEQRLSTSVQKYEEIYEQYQNVERLLALRKQKINSLQQERKQINNEISVTENNIREEEQKLQQLIESYKQTMRYIYKNGRTSQLALVLSSASVNQMIVRNYYLKKFEDYREGQAAAIDSTKRSLAQSRNQLQQAAERNTQVLAEIQTEKQELSQKSELQAANVRMLQQEKNENRDRVQELNSQRTQLRQTLDDLIAKEEEYRQAELERQRRLAAANSSSNSAGEAAPVERPAERRAFSGSEGFLSDDELNKIESNFSAQKGSLQWPVESHTISEHFGQRRHPVYGTVTPNLGVQIVTKPRGEVRVVHSGYVFAVQPMAGYGDVVFVSHGKYKTAYGNLSSVLVKKNTILEQGDVVGYAGDENSTRGESVFFMLRAGTQNVDPEDWLK